MIIMAMVRDKAKVDERQDHHCQHHPDYHDYSNRHADYLEHDHPDHGKRQPRLIRIFALMLESP